MSTKRPRSARFGRLRERFRKLDAHDSNRKRSHQTVSIILMRSRGLESSSDTCSSLSSNA